VADYATSIHIDAPPDVVSRTWWSPSAW